MSTLLHRAFFAFAIFAAAIVRADEVAAIDSIDKLWEGFDPRALPVEVEVVKAWDEGDVHCEMVYFTGEIFVPVVRVTPASASDIERVDIYYCLDKVWPTGRFWWVIPNVRREGDAFVGDTPFFSPEDKLCAFANVTDKSGIRISSRLAKQPAATIAGARPTLQKQSLIDEMDEATAWNWVPAPADPTQQSGTFFGEWRGADGERGFTLDPQMFPHDGPMGFYFGTRKIGDPQFRGTGRTVLLLDCLADHLPDRLTIHIRHHPPTDTGQEYEADFAKTLSAIEPLGAWRTLRMKPAQFHNKQGQPLPDWEHAEFFILDGVSAAQRPPVFKRLRWEDTP